MRYSNEGLLNKAARMGQWRCVYVHHSHGSVDLWWPTSKYHIGHYTSQQSISALAGQYWQSPQCVCARICVCVCVRTLHSKGAKDCLWPTYTVQQYYTGHCASTCYICHCRTILAVCVHACVWVRERQRDREKERDRDCGHVSEQ